MEESTDKPPGTEPGTQPDDDETPAVDDSRQKETDESTNKVASKEGLGEPEVDNENETSDSPQVSRPARKTRKAKTAVAAAEATPPPLKSARRTRGPAAGLKEASPADSARKSPRKTRKQLQEYATKVSTDSVDSYTTEETSDPENIIMTMEMLTGTKPDSQKTEEDQPNEEDSSEKMKPPEAVINAGVECIVDDNADNERDSQTDVQADNDTSIKQDDEPLEETEIETPARTTRKTRGRKTPAKKTPRKTRDELFEPVVSKPDKTTTDPEPDAENTAAEEKKTKTSEQPTNVTEETIAEPINETTSVDVAPALLDKDEKGTSEVIDEEEVKTKKTGKKTRSRKSKTLSPEIIDEKSVPIPEKKSADVAAELNESVEVGETPKTQDDGKTEVEPETKKSAKKSRSKNTRTSTSSPVQPVIELEPKSVANDEKTAADEPMDQEDEVETGKKTKRRSRKAKTIATKPDESVGDKSSAEVTPEVDDPHEPLEQQNKNTSEQLDENISNIQPEADKTVISVTQDDCKTDVEPETNKSAKKPRGKKTRASSRDQPVVELIDLKYVANGEKTADDEQIDQDDKTSSAQQEEVVIKVQLKAEKSVTQDNEETEVVQVDRSAKKKKVPTATLR